MRGRPRKPDGRRNQIGAKFSDDETATVKAAVPEGMKPGEWVRSVLLAAATQAADARIQDRLGIKIIADERMPPGVAALHTPGQPPQVIPVAGKPAGGNCPHPKGSRLKGRCTRCRTFVGYT